MLLLKIFYAIIIIVIKEKEKMSLTVYLGIDVGSVTTKLAVIDETGKYVDSVMLKTAGTPVSAVQNGMRQLYEKRITDYEVMGVGTIRPHNN